MPQSIEKQVDHLFEALNARSGDYCRNPVTDTSFVWGRVSIAAQKKNAVRALRAREHFAANGPPDAPPLPVSCVQREDLPVGLPRICKWYARSWEARGYDLQEHPSFHDYACGVMASDLTPEIIGCDEELLRRFPPRPLAGMGSGLCWQPPRRTVQSRRAA